MPQLPRVLVTELALCLFAASTASAQDWTPTSTAGAPPGFYKASAVWTGKYMLVWGGEDASTSVTNTGGRYDPATDTWTPLSTTNAPSKRFQHTAVWTGTQMIVWGGESIGELNTGGVYDLASDTWTATSTTGAPIGRSLHTAVWTGSEMIIWGGSYLGAPGYNSGGRYDPGTNTWTATTLTGAPVARTYHTAVWTGSEMIVWGGTTSGTLTANALASGGRYSPANDSWTPTTLSGAPSPRFWHPAVWTGSRMMIWGGLDASSTNNVTNTGGLYDPAIDGWTHTSLVAAPDPRALSGMVWTGAEVIVWSGDYGGSTSPIQGGRYDPARDEWTPVNTGGAPAATDYFVDLWTGTQMIVWGGAYYGVSAGLGGLYTPPPLTALKANGSCIAAVSIPDADWAWVIAGGMLGTLLLLLIRRPRLFGGQ